VLEATSGMRRCELAGVRRDLLDLDTGTLAIEITRVVIDGKVIESDGKTENAQHILALDPFTLAALRAHVEMLDREREPPICVLKLSGSQWVVLHRSGRSGT
jgi:integrase